eukprot:637101-Amphidinium_carterae.1
MQEMLGYLEQCGYEAADLQHDNNPKLAAKTLQRTNGHQPLNSVQKKQPHGRRQVLFIVGTLCSAETLSELYAAWKQVSMKLERRYCCLPHVPADFKSLTHLVDSKFGS